MVLRMNGLSILPVQGMLNVNIYIFIEQYIDIFILIYSGWHAGDPPDHRTIEVCKKNLGKECPPITHRGRKITQDDYYKFDYILGMDDSNISNAKSIAPKDATAIVDYLGRFDPEKVLIIEDPYYGGIKEFYEVYEQVYRSCENFYKIHQNS